MNFSYYLSGKILLPDEIPLSSPTISYLLKTDQLKKIPSITTSSFKRHQCNRCGSLNQSLFASIPCARCESEHVYCRHCIQTGRVLACESLIYWNGNQPEWPPTPKPCQWEGSLTPAQQLAADAIIKAQEELMIWAVCGAGKTEMLFPAITKAIQNKKRICIATPRADVVRELFPRFQQAFPYSDIEALYADSDDITNKGQLILSTTHQLIRYQHAFDLMVIDEIDAFPFHHDKTLAYLANRACKKDATTIYLTATPRPDHKRRMTRKNLPTVFVPIRYHGKPLPIPKEKIEWNLRKKLEHSKTPTSLRRFLNNRNTKRQLLIFVPTIDLLQKVNNIIAGTTVHAGDPERKEKVQQFRQKKMDVIITTTILERGVTFPSVDVVVLDAGHEVFDEAALVQIAGRAGRSPDDPDGDVLFVHQGKTNAIEQAIDQIKMMNKKGARL